MSSKINLLVTGSTGFIYGNFIRYMLKNFSEYNISSVDSIKDIKLINSIYANKGHEFYMGDITDYHFINNVFEIEKPDIVIHGAAESFVDKSLIAGQEFVKSNVLGTQVLIDTSIKHKVKKFVYASTDEVYGALNSENDNSWTEESPLNPRNPYSATKASGELLIKAAHMSHGLNYNIMRTCNNYGPRQPRRNLIPVIIANILENKPVPIYGQGAQVREWIHVQSACAAIKKIIDDGKLNEIYNVGSGQEFSNIEVFNEICNLMGKGNELLQFIPDPRKNHDFRYSVNCDKLKNLGWKNDFKFKGVGNSLHATIQWYLNNQWFLK